MTDLTPADPYAAPTRVVVDAVPIAVVRHEGVRLPEIEDFFDADYSVLNAAAAARRIELAGPSLAVYHGDPQGEMDVEIGMPVATPIDPLDGMIPSTLPAGTALVLTHIGSYSGLGGSWAKLARAATSAATADWVEVYVTEPGLVPVERLRTDLFLFVQD